MQFLLAIRILGKRIKAIWFMMQDKKVKLWKKTLIVLGLVYLVLPVDIIPPVLFPIGWIDDAALWAWILYTLKDTLDTYWLKGEKEDYSKKYKNKNIIDDVEYEVKDEREDVVEEDKSE
ncbi:MAG: YkvA family protein [Anaerovoracaceae bacterium]